MLTEERGAERDLDPAGGEFDPAEAERAEHPDSFDPGLETGYLRRGARDHDLPVEVGAAPFDPGPGHYDARRSRRARRRQEKEERRRQARLEKLERERRAEAERIARERRAEAERLARERRAAAERLARERRAESEGVERERRERAARVERERAERAARERRKREQRLERERALKEERQKAEREQVARERPGPVRLKTVPRAKAPARPARLASTPPSRDSLRIPTIKAGAALAVAVAVASALGSLLGLPMPLLSSDPSPDRSQAASLTGAAALAALDAGTPIELTEGPYHPVVGELGYGEGPARFGAPRGGRLHEGQDVFGEVGTPLVAVRDGVVLDGRDGRNFYAGGGGHTAVLYSPIDNRSYVYLHMHKPALVKAGETVRAGQPIGLLGCTGSCYGPHLHFEVRVGRADFGAKTKPIDPLPLLKQWPQRPIGQ